MTPAERLYAIPEQGLCIGCGLCQAVAGPDTIGVVKTLTGDLRPVVVGDLTHDQVDTIYDVCPGTRVDGLPERLLQQDTKIDNVWGPWRRLVLGWAGDPAVRHQGSTGGVLTALGQHLLSSGRVSFILHTKAAVTEPIFGECTLSFTEAEVLEASGSRYGPTATLLDVTDVLDRGEPFAFIGKPCDLTALRNFGRHDPRVDQLVKYWMAPVCGGYGPGSFTRRFLSERGVDPDEVTSFRYRGFGNPGPTTAVTPNGSHSWHYLDYWGEDESQWGLPWRCKICPDGIGESADVAASDTWVGGSPNRVDSETDPGTNALIVRTAAGQELLEAAVADGAIKLGAELTPDDMSHFQPHQMRKKYAVSDRHAGIGDAGRIVPVTNRLRIDELAAEMPVYVNERQRAGARHRISIGKASEPTPQAANE